MSALRSLPAAVTAVAVALVAAPAAHASARYGPAMPAAQIRSLQAQGVREIIVKRDPGLSASEQADLRVQAGISYVGPGPLPNTELDRAPAGGLAAAVAALRQDPQVQYAEPNGEVHAAGVPNDPYFGYQWALSNTGQTVEGTSGTPGDDIGATYVWSHSVTGSGVTVAEVDTGVDSTVPDLAGQLVAGASFLGGVQGTTTQDQNGHGTHVAGIIAAVQNNSVGVSGVAPGAQIMPLQVLDANGSGTIDDVAAAFAYAGQHGIPIVNASLGGPSDSQTLDDAVTSNPNTLYVVAAGNDGTNNDDPSTPFYPCDIPASNLICVGASDQNDQPAYFSNYGATNVDLFAPGVNILSTYLTSQGGYAYDDGTSMATPMVSGALALMLSHNRTLDAAHLKSDLLASVDQEPQFDGLSVSGGELDAAAAVALAGGDAPYGAPGNRELPQIGGDATVGSTLTVSSGSWSRTPTGYAYQWQRCALGVCVPVPYATGTSYPLTATDDGASFDVVVTASNAAGETQAQSAMTAAVEVPGQATSDPFAHQPSSGTTPAPAQTAPTTTTHARNRLLRLTHVALTGRRASRRGQALVFTLSTGARVQLTLARTGRVARPAAGDVFRRAVSARQGQNRYWLTSLLRGRHLAHGRYALTVRAGNRTVTLRLAA